MKAITHVTKEVSIAEIVEAIRSGKHVESYQVGDVLEIGGIRHAIIGIDAEEGLTHSMTVQRINKVYDRIFNDSYRATYEESEIRKYLNGDYANDLPAEFVEAVKPIKVDGMDGEERFFLLSSGELDPETTKYPYYQTKENRTKYDEDGYGTWWWLRDPSAGNSYVPRLCLTDGDIGNNNAHYAYGVAPACVIA